jgi:hypothetical protein
MHSVSASAARSRTGGFLLTLATVTDEICGTFARLIAYVGALALIAILALAGWRQIDRADRANSGWVFADDAVPAFSLRLGDQPDKTATYTVFRHPRGGRKDIFRWGEPADPPIAELEIYRIGSEPDRASAAVSDLAARMRHGASSRLESVGVIDSQFGAIGLLRLTDARDRSGLCLGFLKDIKVPALRISGWSCQGMTMPSLRSAVGCMLNRLTLLSPAQEPDVANLFGSAGPKQAACSAVPAPGTADWVMTADDPRLRGAL